MFDSFFRFFQTLLTNENEYNMKSIDSTGNAWECNEQFQVTGLMNPDKILSYQYHKNVFYLQFSL